MKKFLLSFFALMLAVFSVQAQSELIYTLEPAKGSNSDYTKNCDIVINGITWNLSGNSQMSPWRIGGKSLTKVDRTLYSKTPMEGAVDKVVLSVGTMSNITVNSAKLLVADNANFNNAVTTSFTMNANTDIEIPVSAASGSYYKFVFNVTVSSTSNKFIQISGAEFYGTTGEGGETVETVKTPVITAESTTFNEGESLLVTIETETDGAEIYYTIDGSDPDENSDLYEGEIVLTETTTVKAIAIKEGFNNSEVVEAKFTKTVVIEGGVVDVLNLALTGAEGTTYSSWSDKTSKSSAVYAGQSAGGNSSIQLRSSNSNSGIVTTQSGGKVKKITIDWNSNTAETRELWVYGKNTAYTNPTELYNASTDGDKLAEIVYGTTEFVIEGDYEYIGLRSGSGAMYLNSIEITWVTEEVEETESYTLAVGETGYATLYLDFAATIPTEVKAYTVTAVETGYVTLTEVTGVLPANTGIIVNASQGKYTFAYSKETPATIADNLLKGTVADENIAEAAYVLGIVEGEVGLYLAEMAGGVWLNNANKAYLPIASGAAHSTSLRFDFDGTTGVEKVEIRNEKEEIYDLTGRRVNKITKAGVYVVNGKKILVK